MAKKKKKGVTFVLRPACGRGVVLWVAVVAVLVGARPVHAASNPKQFTVSSPVYLCDGQAHTLPAWTAPVPLTVVDVVVWIGTDDAAPGQPYPAADVYTTVYSSHEPGYVLAFYARDAYAAPNASHQLDKAFPDNQAVTLQAGQTIGFGHHCQALFGATSHSQTLVIVTYREVQP